MFILKVTQAVAQRKVLRNTILALRNTDTKNFGLIYSELQKKYVTMHIAVTLEKLKSTQYKTAF